MMDIKHIFHISDIHIRNGDEKTSRYTEYNNVFQELFISIKNNTLYLNRDEFVIVITGDIFHNKNVIGNYGLKLYKSLIENLTKIGKTIILHGNHDRNQSELNQPSLISSTIQLENLILLDQTTSFVIGNVGFSYVSIDDTLDSQKTCGRIKKLPSFPEIETHVQYKIALFHGTFANVKLYNGNDVTDVHEPYPFEWIEDFDFAILGDIHLRQKGFHKKTLWGYSGSLIQQNFGEDVLNHGYMIWDLKNKEIREIDVYNKCGFINIKQNEDKEILLRKRGKYESLLEDELKNNIAIFPKELEIRMYYDIDIQYLVKLLLQYNIEYRLLSNCQKITNTKNITNNYGNDNDHNDNVDKNTILEYFQDKMTQEQYTILSSIMQDYKYLLFDMDKYDEELKEDCLKKNKEITNYIFNCEKTDENHKYHNPFTIKYIEWENLYCYERKNWINFENLESSTFLISGNNGTGKSAIYDIITYGIWGEISATKQNFISNGIINNKHEFASTIVDIEINGRIYRINRFLNKNKKNKSCIYEYVNNANNSKNITLTLLKKIMLVMKRSRNYLELLMSSYLLL